MSRKLRFLGTGLITALTLSVSWPRQMGAHHVAATSGRVPMTVALVDSLPSAYKQYDALVVRSGAIGRDIILLPRATATGELLDAATRVLLDARLRGWPSNVASKQTITLGVRRAPASPEWEQRVSASARRIVDKLKTAPAREVPGVGIAPALNIYPPAIRAAPRRSTTTG